VIEKRVLRIFKPKKEVTGGWKKIHEEEIPKFCFLPSIIRVSNQGCAVWGRNWETYIEMQG
jgi:hypothetical protein